MNKYTLVTALFVLLLNSCTSLEESDEIIKKDIVVQVDENKKFIKYLESDWEETLINNPLFASYTGDKRFNDKINSNSIKEFNDSKKSDLSSLSKLRQINESNLSDENKLNYKLKEFDLVNNIESKEFPIYFLRLNQRGGIQSFYET